jgi:hypothetical protein
MSVVVGAAGGNYNVLVSHLLNRREGKNGKLSGLRSALSLHHLSLSLQPRPIAGILCSGSLGSKKTSLVKQSTCVRMVAAMVCRTCYAKNEYNRSLGRMWFLRSGELSLEMAH